MPGFCRMECGADRVDLPSLRCARSEVCSFLVRCQRHCSKQFVQRAHCVMARRREDRYIWLEW
jgi:hypothetical protein